MLPLFHVNLVPHNVVHLAELSLDVLGFTVWSSSVICQLSAEHEQFKMVDVWTPELLIILSQTTSAVDLRALVWILQASLLLRYH